VAGSCPALYSEGLGVFLVGVFAWLMGFGATCAEPALNTLGITVERLTVTLIQSGGWQSWWIVMRACAPRQNGKFKRSMLIGAVSFGVATGITVGVMRLIYMVKLIYILIPAYSVALALTTISSEEYVCVAWDSAGVTTGPITVPLVPPPPPTMACRDGPRDGPRACRNG
jgi:hypothetical protein